jgi:5-methylcytosine-specific restriction endonuclease McrA
MIYRKLRPVARLRKAPPSGPSERFDPAFYNSWAWRTLSASKRRADPLCEVCLRCGIHSPTECVDHKIPRAVDRSLELAESNLQSLCWSCHGRKTRAEQQKGIT